MNMKCIFISNKVWKNFPLDPAINNITNVHQETKCLEHSVMWSHTCYPSVLLFCYWFLLSLIKYFFDIKSMYFTNGIWSSKLISLHQKIKIEKALSVVCRCLCFILNTIKSPILVNGNFLHLYIVPYEDGNSNFNILTRHVFDDLNGFQSYSRIKIKHKIILECIIILTKTS